MWKTADVLCAIHGTLKSTPLINCKIVQLRRADIISSILHEKSGWIAKSLPHSKNFSREFNRKSCIFTRFFAWKETQDARPFYTRNFFKLHDSLGLNLWIFCMIYTINHAKFMQFLECLCWFSEWKTKLKTARENKFLWKMLIEITRYAFFTQKFIGFFITREKIAWFHMSAAFYFCNIQYNKHSILLWIIQKIWFYVFHI